MRIVKAADALKDPAIITAVVEVLRAGGLVCFPLRGNYRLAADLRSEDAVMRLLQSKRRTANHPALLLVADLDAAATVVDGTSWPTTRRLAERFWPGPLTMVLDASPQLPAKLRKLLAKATGKLGVRVTDDPLAAKVVRAFGGPLLLSSANIAKKPGASSAAAVRQRFSGNVELWLEAGDPAPQPPSTLVDVEETAWKVVRVGAITTAEIERALR